MRSLLGTGMRPSGTRFSLATTSCPSFGSHFAGAGTLVGMAKSKAWKGRLRQDEEYMHGKWPRWERLPASRHAVVFGVAQVGEPFSADMEGPRRRLLPSGTRQRLRQTAQLLFGGRCYWSQSVVPDVSLDWRHTSGICLTGLPGLSNERAVLLEWVPSGSGANRGWGLKIGWSARPCTGAEKDSR